VTQSCQKRHSSSIIVNTSSDIEWRPRGTIIANETQIKFGYPDTLIADYQHWCVLARPAQATLGAMVLVCKEDATSFSSISPAAFTEMGIIIPAIEAASKAFRPWQKINYLMLMMVDPNVHFHVLPRYETLQSFQGTDYADSGWPGPPDLGNAVTPGADTLQAIIAELKSVWPDRGGERSC
jgi:diadenosine tetraphosphate (Ap4A) HIT family hydrolase